MTARVGGRSFTREPRRRCEVPGSVFMVVGASSPNRRRFGVGSCRGKMPRPPFAASTRGPMTSSSETAPSRPQDLAPESLAARPLVSAFSTLIPLCSGVLCPLA
jgi:hypothetical protein